MLMCSFSPRLTVPLNLCPIYPKLLLQHITMKFFYKHLVYEKMFLQNKLRCCLDLIKMLIYAFQFLIRSYEMLKLLSSLKYFDWILVVNWKVSGYLTCISLMWIQVATLCCHFISLLFVPFRFSCMYVLPM